MLILMTSHRIIRIVFKGHLSAVSHHGRIIFSLKASNISIFLLLR
jgi:hypothetical protein